MSMSTCTNSRRILGQRRAVMIGKGESISDLVILFENGENWVWKNISNFRNINKLILTIIGKHTTLFSRSWEIKTMGLDMPYTSIKTYYCQKTGSLDDVEGLLIRNNLLETAWAYWETIHNAETIEKLRLTLANPDN